MKKNVMQHLPFHHLVPAAGLIALLCAAGCGDNGSSSAPSTPSGKPAPQTYFAPSIAGTTNGNTALYGPKTFAFDEVQGAFSESNLVLSSNPSQFGPLLINAGNLSTGKRGLLNVKIITSYTLDGQGGATPGPAPKGNSFAVELPKQAGGFVQLVGQPVTPLGAASQCPSISRAQSYLFLTLPQGALDSKTVTSPQKGFWDPRLETSYGSVDIATDGSTVNLSNIQHRTLTGTSVAGLPSSASGVCAPGSLGNITMIGQSTINNPGIGINPPAATAKMSIGSSGLLVEDTGIVDGVVDLTSGNYADKLKAILDSTLGAGNGAIGIPKPASPVDLSALRSAQYLGFTYGSGIYAGSVSFNPLGWSSHLTSFGFSSQPAGCSTLVPGGGSLLYGGDYTNEDPSTYSDGFGNCNLAIDLGTQEAATNGLFLNARLWIGGSYAANTTGATFSVPIVAIAGQLDGKYAIFALGFDSKQAWSVYLLQSN